MMIKYEELTHILLKAARGAGLHVYNIKNMINTLTCDKEFSYLCATGDSNTQHAIRAEVDFHWDSVLTAQSVYGGNCSLYHDENIPCPHDQLEPELIVELQIKYIFESDDAIETVNNELSSVFSQVMQHENIPVIRWQLVVSNEGEKKITSIWAVHYWDIDIKEEINLNNIFKDIYDVLKGMEALVLIKK